jgi:hypothetical protein
MSDGTGTGLQVIVCWSFSGRHFLLEGGDILDHPGREKFFSLRHSLFEGSDVALESGDETAQSDVDRLLKSGIGDVIGGNLSSSSFCRRGITPCLSLADILLLLPCQTVPALACRL